MHAAETQIDNGRHRLRMPFILRWLARRPRDTIVGALVAFAAIVILINALFLQKGPHPAPIFALPASPSASGSDPIAALLQQGSSTAAPRETTASARARSDMVAEIQRELARRGFYDGPADGIYGPKTDSAIRDFEAAAGLRPSADPNDVLLAAIRRSDAKAQPTQAGRDAIARLLTPDKRIVAIQRALSDFGYGPVRPTGVYDAQTKEAIARFERARKRPSTGQVSEQFVRDLSMMTGRPLE